MKSESLFPWIVSKVRVDEKVMSSGIIREVVLRRVLGLGHSSLSSLYAFTCSVILFDVHPMILNNIRIIGAAFFWM